MTHNSQELPLIESSTPCDYCKHGQGDECIVEIDGNCDHRYSGFDGLLLTSPAK